MVQVHEPSKACHNCRKRRLKCDQSLPQCVKCINRGQACLGYGRLLRWERGIASRGKMAGKTFSPASPQGLCQSGISSLGPSLTEPLLQDLDHSARSYLLYFASDVCKDLALYDTPKHNPFRELIPLAQHHPILLQIIIANSALHMSNASQKFLCCESTNSSLSGSTSPSSSSHFSFSYTQHYQPYHDALVAKQQALHLLKANLPTIASVDVDVTLAVVLLFIDFELIDTGQDNWKHHVDGAKTMIGILCRPKILAQPIMSPLRSCLISNCLVYDILGSSLASSIGTASHDTYSTGAMTLLRDEEGNHCSSFPMTLLQLIQAGARLYQQFIQSCSPDPHSISALHVEEAIRVLSAARSFDPATWAKDVQARSPFNDLTHRAHVAHAHRAAVCIYLSRVALFMNPSIQLPETLESLVIEIITHSSLIRPHDALFTATTWPAFIAGAETDDLECQQWVVRRFRELWEVEPWGLMRGALEVLERIWADRQNRSDYDGSKMSDQRSAHPAGTDWLVHLRRRGVDWLIL